jgi:hypothetical protein
LVAAGSARATTIGQFTFDDGTLASSDADPNSTASLALNGPSGVGGEDGNPPPGLIVSLPFSSAGELYQSVVITLTPAAGYELNLSSLTFDGSTSYFSPTIPSATFLAAVRSNLDGFASDIGTASWAAGHQTPGFVSILIDLSAAAFQGLSAADLAPVGGSLQLKFFLAMTSCPPVGGVNSYLDNLLVSGTTTLAPPPVPEPAAALLVVLGLAGAALRRSLS